MGYRLVTVELLALMRSQSLLGESNRGIARNLGLDRGTVNRYLEAIKALGIAPESRFAEAPGLPSARSRTKRLKLS